MMITNFGISLVDVSFRECVHKVACKVYARFALIFARKFAMHFSMDIRGLLSHLLKTDIQLRNRAMD